MKNMSKLEINKSNRRNYSLYINASDCRKLNPLGLLDEVLVILAIGNVPYPRQARLTISTNTITGMAWLYGKLDLLIGDTLEYVIPAAGVLIITNATYSTGTT